jgi:hypothetical protein
MKANHFPAIGVVSMLPILKQYATANQLPLNPRNWESIVRTFNHYNQTAKNLN